MNTMYGIFSFLTKFKNSRCTIGLNFTVIDRGQIVITIFDKQIEHGNQNGYTNVYLGVSSL